MRARIIYFNTVFYCYTTKRAVALNPSDFDVEMSDGTKRTIYAATEDERKELQKTQPHLFEPKSEK